MRLTVLLTGASMAILVATAAQAADNFLIQLEDTATNGTVVGNTYQNGALIQSVTFCCEAVQAPYVLWNSATVITTFDNQFNFYEPGTSVLSDTAEISGNAGDNFLTFSFLSDNGSLLNALPFGGHFDENGQWQDIVAAGIVSNGDFYQIQMRSDLDVPEPATWTLMLIGFGGLGVALRSRRRAPAAA